MLRTFALLRPFIFAALALAAASPVYGGGGEFFEKRIRPVLVKHCYECHSAEADELSGNLAVDTREGLRQGGDNGPAITPGDVESSFLLRAISYEDDAYQMPPDGKLPEEVLRDFERWVRIGAPDPRDGAAPRSTVGIDLAAGREFWAFRPLTWSLPAVANTDWARSEIDVFVLAQLEAAGLTPAPRAGPQALIRRLYFDLVGLPPPREEVERFVADDSREALVRVVEHLLASPRFGERWGRHWLDVVRYADSNGLDQNLTYYNAWRYRDYVIDSFNRDKPFDHFVAEQIAGDLLPYDDDQQRAEQLVGTGFLMVGPKQLSERDKEKLRMDVVDEQIDTVGKALLGLTLGCARCHDHKFDPIPMSEYYALAGIFRSTATIDGIKLNNVFVSGWKVRPLPIAPQHARALAEHEGATTRLTESLKEVQEELKRLEDRMEMDRAKRNLLGVVVDDPAAKKVGQWKDSTYSPNYIGQGYLHDDRSGKGQKSVTFTPELPEAGVYEIRISYTPGKGRSPGVPVTVRHADGEETIAFNQQDAPPIDKLFRAVGRYRFEAGQAGSVTISNTGTDGYHVIADAVQFIPLALLERGTQAAGGDAADAVTEDAAQRVRRDQLAARVGEFEKQLKQLSATAPPPAPFAMAVEDVPQPGDYHLLVRGNHERLGELVPRSVLSVIPGHAAPVFSDQQSGRRELAEWIACSENPLTARVLVNRVWQHLLGEGLVRSVDNFGRLGEPPTHPRLLDYLATRFVQRGWSVKEIVREIVLSQCYQMAVDENESAAGIDPENRLLWRANRRRLDAEALCDAMLYFSDELDLTMGGSMVESLGEQALNNESQSPIDTDTILLRSVYLPILRSDLPPLLAAFDFADPELVTGRRDGTTVPTQALFMMNSPFVLERARQAAQQLIAAEHDEAARVDRLYYRSLSRPPRPSELQAALAYLDRQREIAGQTDRPKTEVERDAWGSLCQAILASTEFRFLE